MKLFGSLRVGLYIKKLHYCTAAGIQNMSMLVDFVKCIVLLLDKYHSVNTHSHNARFVARYAESTHTTKMVLDYAWVNTFNYCPQGTCRYAFGHLVYILCARSLELFCLTWKIRSSVMSLNNRCCHGSLVSLNVRLFYDLKACLNDVRFR